MENENNQSASLNRIKSSRPIESSVLRSCRPFSRRNARPLDSSTTRTDGPPLYVINISLNGDNSLKVIDDQWTSESTSPDPGKRKPIVIQRTIKVFGIDFAISGNIKDFHPVFFPFRMIRISFTFLACPSSLFLV